ncbi:MAG TPA: hypothetical protein VJC10_00010 [Patescibacteria group bacterium]|nr:hypothetical protein [Patescibacteria group bacterium]
MDKFLNLYSKYPWVAIVIVAHWIATALVIIYARDINVTNAMGLTFFSTVIFAYFGFKVPKG